MSPSTPSGPCSGSARPAPSTVGLVLAAVSLLIMPLLSYGQRRAGRELGSRSAVADSKQTLLCTYLSAVLLVGLGLNSAFGWSWADPIAALVIAAVAVKEGREAWQGDTCCAPDLSAPITTTRTNGTLDRCGLSVDVTAVADACTDGCCRPTTAERRTYDDQTPISTPTTPATTTPTGPTTTARRHTAPADMPTGVGTGIRTG